jgi:hypothetical protein
LEALGLTLDLADALPPAALPPTPIEDDVPALPVEVPAVPSVEADVPPDAALPPLPTVPEDPVGDVDVPPVAAPLALCASAYAGSAISAPASKTLPTIMMLSLFISCLRYRRCNSHPKM